MRNFKVPSRNVGFTVRFDGVIELLSPFASSWPAGAGKKVKGYLKLPRTLCVDVNDSESGVPFITAASLRGALRRAAMDVVLSVSGVKLSSIAEYYLNTVGGAKGRKVAAGTDSEEVAEADGEVDEKKLPEAALTDYSGARRRNPILGIFGASEVMGSMMEGHLKMGNAVPKTFTVGVYKGVRQDDTRVRPERVEQSVVDDDLAITVKTLHERARYHSALKQEIAELSRVVSARMQDKKSPEYLSAKDRLNEKQKEEKSIVDVTVMMPLEGFEYLNPVSIPHSMVLKDVSLVEAGLFFLSISRLMDDPFLGAHRAVGFGKFQAEWEVTVNDQQGDLVATPFSGISCDLPFVAEAIDAAMEAIRSGEIKLDMPTVGSMGKFAA